MLFRSSNIRHANELEKFVQLMKTEIKPLENNLFIPVDVYLNYVQDSNIQSTGNIYITGKGQYVSELTALKDIIFTTPGAVSRGGILDARENITCKTIGSVAGVGTTLKVLKTGQITADIVYQNTVFCFGDRQYTFEDASKQVKAYYKDGDIVVEKFLL